MNNKGEFEIGVMGAMALIMLAGYAMMAYDSHEKSALKMKALDKGCTPEQIEKITKD
jgi:hypothetical protein